MLVPERYSQFMARASEYGNSRVVLGVHYPLDVILGRVIGTFDVVQMLNNNPKYTNFTVNRDVTTTNNFQTLFTAAQTDVRNLLQTGCGSESRDLLGDEHAGPLQQRRAEPGGLYCPLDLRLADLVVCPSAA